MIYKNCGELPLINFIKCVVHEDLSQLGDAPEDELSAAWDRISDEYNSLTSSNASSHLLELTRNITTLKMKYENTIWCCELLSRVDDVKEFQDTISVLRSYGFMFSFSNESLTKDLEFTISAAKNFLVDLKQTEQEYEKATSQSTTQVTEQDYYDMIGEIEKWQGVKLDMTMTVSQYISYLNRFKKHCDG